MIARRGNRPSSGDCWHRSPPPRGAGPAWGRLTRPATITALPRGAITRSGPPGGTSPARPARNPRQPRWVSPLKASVAEATIRSEAPGRVTSAASRCTPGVPKNGGASFVGAFRRCPFRAVGFSGRIQDTTSSTAKRQHDLARPAQQRSLGGHRWHSGPVQPCPPSRRQPPTSGGHRPCQEML